jgi:NAD(P)-dependent dehydrogenase (short-subunit alcohol dehydrogenase family)
LYATDYVCLVTGGGTGIGLMFSQALAANGAKVYITSRDLDQLQTAAKEHSKDVPGQIIPVGPCDVSNKDDLEKLYKQIASKEDRLDLLVANAGVSGAKADPAEETDGAKMKENLWPNESVDDWKTTYGINVAAVYFSVVAFLPLLGNAVKIRGDFGPSVITTSSMSGQIRQCALASS